MQVKLRQSNIAQVMEDIKEAHEDVMSGAMRKVQCIQLIAECREVKMILVNELWEELYRGVEYDV
ncbi:hypothetical protein NIGALANA_275 [Bacillus phage Nigalana]|uniref:hypothetical protein n=1 Tax=Bacillus phage Nigalana TaxID=1805951 RepID=UPI0007A76F3A|nr:hypothetical protein BI005_gp275 [Bacillus phage Nigalana]AMW61421.1 hypothetical protein NIGALANA_275 [Bacillus phage Nigalana]